MLRQVIKLIEQNGMTLEQAAQHLSQYGQKISADNLNKKLLTGKIKLSDVKKILDMLGYKMTIKKDK